MLRDRMIGSRIWVVAAIGLGWSWAGASAADEKRKGGSRGGEPDAAQFRDIEEQAQKIGPWEQQVPLIEQATDSIFQQQGWNSEPDQYARELMRQVSRIPPWQSSERQQVFLDSLQTRLSLSTDQRELVDREFKRESMALVMRHWKETLPVVMEVIRTRAGNEPFSPEQVQRWSRQMQPMMDDALKSFDVMTAKLEKTMSPEQRKQLLIDKEAVMRRHHDMEKMVKKWQAGEWSPQDWGLQNDPAHAALAAQAADREAARNRLVAQAMDQDVNERGIATTEDEWQRFVRTFCDQYGLDDRQRSTAEAILASARKEAVAHRGARKKVIEQLENQIKTASGEPGRSEAAKQLQRELAPIEQIFNRMRQRLEGLLTSEQRRLHGSSSTAAPPVRSPSGGAGVGAGSAIRPAPTSGPSR